jgi:hypothetical protein
MYLEYIVCVHNYLKGVGATAYRDDSQHDQVDWFACNQARRLCHWKVDKQVVFCFLFFVFCFLFFVFCFLFFVFCFLFFVFCFLFNQILFSDLCSQIGV